MSKELEAMGKELKEMNALHLTNAIKDCKALLKNHINAMQHYIESIQGHIEQIEDAEKERETGTAAIHTRSVMNTVMERIKFNTQYHGRLLNLEKELDRYNSPEGQ